MILFINSISKFSSYIIFNQTLINIPLRILHKSLTFFSTNIIDKVKSKPLNVKIDIEESARRGKLIPEIDLSNIGVSSQQGRRPGNEDRFLISRLKQNLLIFALFDGHGGSGAVDFIYENIEEFILSTLESSEIDNAKALQKSIKEINNEFLKKATNKYKESDYDDSGSTATICLLSDGLNLLVGHVGDTRASLCRSTRLLRLTQDHDPSNTLEADRIIKSNGVFTHSSYGKSRVNGKLEMTRSIGDWSLKKYGVVADPDIIKIKIKHSQDAFLLLTTDGVHNTLSNQELLSLGTNALDPTEAASNITDQSLINGSSDNCTAIVIPLGMWGKLKVEQSFVIPGLSRF